MTEKPASPAPDFLTPDELAAEADEREWQQVSEDDVEETKHVFEALNVPFIGVYAGLRIVETAEGKFTQFKFDKPEGRYFITASWNLIQGMQRVREGQTCRITWIGERDTGQLSPMRIFKVDVQRATAPSRGTRSGQVLSTTTVKSR